MAVDIDLVIEQYNESKKRLEPLHERMDFHFDLWSKKKYVAKDSNYESYTSNEPRTLADKITGLMSQGRVNISIPMDHQQAKVKEKIPKAEKLVWGALYQNDMNLSLMGQHRLQDSLSWYIVVRGWVSRLVLVYKNENGNTVVEIRALDPRWVFYDQGRDGLNWSAHLKYMTWNAINNEYGADIPKTDKLISVLDYYDDEVNAVLHMGTELSDSFTGDWLKAPTAHQIGHNPVSIAPVGLAPLVAGEDGIKHVGESIYSANDDIYEPQNKVWSWRMDTVAVGIKQAYKVYSMGGRAELTSDPNRPGGEIPLDVDKKEDVVPLEKSRMPLDTDAMIAKFSGDTQHGGLPDISWGRIPGPIAGYLAAQLDASTQSVLKPRLIALEDVYRGIAHEIVGQFSSGGFKPINLSGYDNAGKTFVGLTLKSNEVKGDWFWDVSVRPELAQDKMMAFQMASVAKKEGLLDDETILDEILHAKDPKLVINKLYSQMADRIPQIGMGRIVNALDELGELQGEHGKIKAEELYRMLMMMMGGGQPEPQPGGMEQPGMGVAPPPTGPPEMGPQEGMPGMGGGI